MVLRLQQHCEVKPWLSQPAIKIEIHHAATWVPHVGCIKTTSSKNPAEVFRSIDASISRSRAPVLSFIALPIRAILAAPAKNSRTWNSEAPSPSNPGIFKKARRMMISSKASGSMTQMDGAKPSTIKISLYPL